MESHVLAQFLLMVKQLRKFVFIYYPLLLHLIYYYWVHLFVAVKLKI